MTARLLVKRKQMKPSGPPPHALNENLSANVCQRLMRPQKHKTKGQTSAGAIDKSYQATKMTTVQEQPQHQFLGRQKILGSLFLPVNFDRTKEDSRKPINQSIRKTTFSLDEFCIFKILTLLSTDNLLSLFLKAHVLSQLYSTSWRQELPLALEYSFKYSTLSGKWIQAVSSRQKLNLTLHN